jgi:hypothetical protein
LLAAPLGAFHSDTYYTEVGALHFYRCAYRPGRDAVLVAEAR